MDASSRISQFREFRAPLGSKGARAESQEKRRQDALTRQREQRQQAFSFARDGWEQVADALSDSEDDEGDLTHGADSTLKASGTGNGSFVSPADGNDMLAEPTSADQAPSASLSEAHGSLPKRIKKKWRSYADKLMQGEALDLSDETGGLPADLFSDWLALGPVPKGKRCLAVTFSSMRMSSRGRMTNTLLLARQTGRPLARHLVPSLPPDCVLDCIYSEAHATLFVLDLLRWKSQSISESEAEFRMFWRDSKLSELGPQILPQPAPSAQDANRENGDPMSMASGASRRTSHGQKPAQLIVLPVPCSPAPLNPHTLVNDLVQPACAHAKATVSFVALVPHAAEAQGEQRPSRKQQMSSRNAVAQTVSMEYDIDGLLLLVKSASYESGLTPLAAWISKDELPKFGQALVTAMQ